MLSIDDAPHVLKGNELEEVAGGAFIDPPLSAYRLIANAIMHVASMASAHLPKLPEPPHQPSKRC